MARINVIKAFNFLYPDGKMQHFEPGLHEVGTYRKPVWDKERDAPVEGKFTEHEIADHSYVKQHLGKMPSREELLAEAERMRAQAEAMTKQAESATQSSEDEAAANEPEKTDAGNRVAPNTRSRVNAEVKANTKS